MTTRAEIIDTAWWAINRTCKGIDHTWAALRSIRAAGARPRGAPLSHGYLKDMARNTNWDWAAVGCIKAAVRESPDRPSSRDRLDRKAEARLEDERERMEGWDTSAVARRPCPSSGA
ncbi:hypothetical protein GCM10020219_088850 [Nonomuraea dietziae]